MIKTRQMIWLKRVCGNGRTDNNNGNEREHGEKNPTIKNGTFVRCVCGKERAWYIGPAKKLIIFFFMENA